MKKKLPISWGYFRVSINIIISGFRSVLFPGFDQSCEYNTALRKVVSLMNVEGVWIL